MALDGFINGSNRFRGDIFSGPEIPTHSNPSDNGNVNATLFLNDY